MSDHETQHFNQPSVDAMREQMYADLQTRSETTTLGGVEALPTDPRALVVPFNQAPLDSFSQPESGFVNNQALVAAIRAGRELFGVVKTYDPDFDVDRYLLTRFATEENSGGTLVGMVGENDWLAVGARPLADRKLTDIDDQLSQRHFRIKVGATGIVVEDTGSLNGTDVAVNAPTDTEQSTPNTQQPAWAMRPKTLHSRIAFERRLETTGRVSSGYDQLKQGAAGGNTYKGRHLVEPDQPVSGRVDFRVRLTESGARAIEGPAIVIAETGKESEPYHRLYETAKAAGTQFAPEGSPPTDFSMVDGAYKAVHELLPYSQEQLKATIKQMRIHGIGNGALVDLGAFIGTGVGAVCFEQGLAAAKAIEMFQAEYPHLGGKVSVESRQDWRPEKEGFAGHQWARFTAKDGTIFIIDPAQNVRGRLKDILVAERALPENERTGWHYLRSNETYDSVVQTTLAIGSTATRPLTA